jgi:hypothetical protein
MTFAAMFPDLPRGVIRFVSTAVFLLIAIISYYIQNEDQKAYEILKEQNLLDEDTIDYYLPPLAVAIGLGGFAAALWSIILWVALNLLIVALCVVALFMRAIEWVGSLLGFRASLIDEAPGALLIGGSVAMCVWLGFLFLY